MPAGSSAVRILYQLNHICRDLTWLTVHPHYGEVRQPGHWDDMTLCECQLWAGVGPQMAAHIWADMSRDDREAIRAAVVEAAENGTSLRWEIGGKLDHAKVVTARVLGGTVTLFLPRASERISDRVGV